MSLSTLAVAESMTGGLLASSFVDHSGASAFFRGGIVAYTDDIKLNVLGVTKAALGRNSASKDTAVAMAKAVRVLFKADWGIGITGYAEPPPIDVSEQGKAYAWIAVWWNHGLDTLLVSNQDNLPRNEFRALVVLKARELLNKLIRDDTMCKNGKD